MKEANAINKTNEPFKSKRKSDTPYNYWIKILRKTFQSIPRLPNGIWFILACLAAPVLGIMSVPKIAVISLTLFVIFVAIVVGSLAYNHINDEEVLKRASEEQTSKESIPVKIPQQNVTITTTGQHGDNTGIVNNFAPPQREITQAQRDSFKNDLAAIPNKENVSVMAASQDGEISGYASQIFDMLLAAGFKNIAIGSTFPAQTKWVGVTVVIKDPVNPPLIVGPLLEALAHANIKVTPLYDPTIDDRTLVMINVGKAE